MDHEFDLDVRVDNTSHQLGDYQMERQRMSGYICRILITAVTACCPTGNVGGNTCQNCA